MLLSVITGVVFYTVNGIIEDEVGAMSINSLYKTRDRIDVVLEDAVKLSAQLSLTENINVFMLSNESDFFRDNIYSSVKDTIRMYTGVFNYVDSIYIYSSKRQFIVSNLDSGSLDAYEDKSWYDEYEKRKNEPAWTQVRMKSNKYPYLISYVNPVKLNENEPLGAIIINLDVEKMEKLALNSIKETDDKVMIVDDNNNIIFSTDHSLLMSDISKLEFYKDIPLNNKESFRIMGDKKHEQMVSVVTSDYHPWKFVSVIPLSAYEERLNRMSGFIRNFIIISALFAFIFAAFLSVRSYNPVKNILSLLKNPGQWDEEKGQKTNNKRDEIKDIALNIVRNVYSNQQLQKEIKDYMVMLDKAQTTALQAQINPHFLYNTLETIRWMAMGMSNGDNPVSQVVLNLSELLRLSLDNNEQIITIEEEIRHAKLYVSILMLRYGEKLEVEWKVDESILNCKTVKICLQPIIENAVYHGIKPLRKQGRILISVFPQDSVVIIEVSDNGVGMESGMVKELNTAMKEKYLLKSEHIGMQNVNQRIKLLLGEEYGIEVSSEPQVGTTVTINLPRQDMAEGNAG